MYEDVNGRFKTTIGLKFIAPIYFKGGSARVVCKATVGLHKETREQILYLHPVSNSADKLKYAAAGAFSPLFIFFNV